MQTTRFLDQLQSDPEAVSRFWERVEVATEDECWPVRSRGATMISSYGRLKVGTKLIGTHRIAWALHNGVEPEGRLIRHSCDNPGCCNPKHLLVGTHADNASDKMGRNRWRAGDHKGERNPRALLTAKQVGQIVVALRRGESGKSIARRYPVSHSMVSRIATGRAWISEAAKAGWEPAIRALTARLPHENIGK